MSAPEASQLSKSARKRANKKAREAAGAEEEEAPAPKTNSGKENTSSNPKAAAKAAAAVPQPEKVAQPKAKGKAAAAPKAEPKAAAPAEVPKAKPASKPAAKPASKPAAKPGAKAAAKPVEEEPEKKEQLVQPFELDDGTGGDWESASGMSKKMQRSKERREAKQEQEKLLKVAAAKAPGGTQYIPGMAPVIETKAASKAGAAAPSAANASVSAAAAKSKEEEPKVAQEVTSTVTIKIPEDKVARVIGPKGSVMNMIKEKTGIKGFDMDANTCTLLGEPKAVAQAEAAVQEIIQKGYCSMAFEDFSEATVSCCKIDISNIIGQQGATIKLIKEACKVEVNMPQTADKDPKSNPYKKMKISIAGGSEGVEKCKEVINSILSYGHHEITNPGVVHEELEIAEWQYAYIIGTKGSEMRHIQKNFDVKVNIPREHSIIQNVLVVGEPRNVERASAYIWKTIERASQPRGRGAPDKAEDTWGDEDEPEEWMKQYMYKR